MKKFENINRGYNRVFKPGQLSVGIVAPIENYAQGPVPTMQQHVERAQQVDQLGFKALWVRDIPFNVPSFGDAGQTYEPFTYLGYLAAQTKEIALGISSIALPLHHPVHVSKAAASVDQLSGGRMILGVASGDRPDEYPAMGIDFENRGTLFRESFAYIRKTQEHFPSLPTDNYGELNGQVDMLPKPKEGKIPMLMTGSSRQTLEWNAEHADGWMSYPKDLLNQYNTIKQWRELVAKNKDYDKPFMQPLYVVLQENHDFKPQPIALGFKIGAYYLRDYLHQLEDIGVNHVAVNLRFNSMNMDRTLETLANKVLTHFHESKTEKILS